MATEKTDFLKFNAYSMKELITRKMSEDSRFTDQIYEGSNLAILIDLVAYMYQVLVYQLNNAASESMFSDTQVYDNITRLVKLIGYNPSGCVPSSFRLNFQLEDDQDSVTIPFYSRISTGKTDRNGKEIYFSTASAKNTDNGGNINVESGKSYIIDVFNGEWKLYRTVFVASGLENETFVLEGVGSDSERQMYVSTNMINVVIKRGDQYYSEEWKSDANGIFLNYTNDSSIYNTNNTNIYSPDSKVYSVRLNHNKEYEITFGNGIVGAKLNKGDIIYVFYLESNGPDGEIDINDVDWDNAKIEHTKEMFGVSEETYKKFFMLGDDEAVINGDTKYSMHQLQQSTSRFIPEQGVQDIRENAPNWFKCGNRLITPYDYQYFIKNVAYVRDYIPDIKVIDVKAMSNTEYIATFFKWLYLNGRQFHGNGRYYFNNQQFWNQFQYVMADPADANNTYIWIKSDNSGDTEDGYDVSKVEQFINEKLNPVKTMTTEIKVLKPVLVNFDVCANPSYDYIRTMYLESLQSDFDAGIESYIEITTDNQSMFVGNQLQSKIYDIITEFFDIRKMKMGQNIEFGDITKKIYQIDGIQNIRTIYKSILSDQYFSVNGLAFASWSPILQTSQDGDGTGYDDLQVSTSSRKLEQFQFPIFVGGATLKKRIKIISKTQTQVNTIGQ